MNKTTIIAIVSFFIIGIIMGSQLRGCGGGRGAKGGQLIHTDTLIHFVPRTDTLWQTITQSRDIPYRVWGHDTVIVQPYQRISGSDTGMRTLYTVQSDTAVYADSLREADLFRAIITDTLTANRIIGRSLRWADLSPIEVKTVTNTVLKKQPLIKAYLGAEAYGGRSGGKVNIDLAPAASLIFADRYMVDLGYYIFDQQVTAGMKVRLGR
jgi:hypothetical protein